MASQQLAPCARRCLAGEKGHGLLERCEPVPEIRGVLFRQKLGRRHDGHLPAAANRARRCKRGDHCLATADVTLDQAQHGSIATEIAIDLLRNSFLRARQLERQIGAQALRKRCVRERPGLLLFNSPAQQAQAQVVRQQFFEGKAPLGGMSAKRKLIERRIRRGSVNESQCFRKRWQLELAVTACGSQSWTSRVRQQTERLSRERAQTTLLHAFGGRIDRCQCEIDGQRLSSVHASIFGMHDFEAAGSAPGLPIDAQARAAREAGLLTGAEVKESKRQPARTIGDPAQQLASAAIHNLAQLDSRLDGDARPVGQTADRAHMRAIFVAQRQQEPEILHRAHVEFLEARGERFTDTGEARDRLQLGSGGRIGLPGSSHAARARGQGQLARWRMQSISTSAPRGSVATPMVVRVGYGSRRYSAITLLTVGNAPKSVR